MLRSSGVSSVINVFEKDIAVEYLGAKRDAQGLAAPQETGQYVLSFGSAANMVNGQGSRPKGGIITHPSAFIWRFLNSLGLT